MNDFLYMNFIFLLQEINYGYFLVYFLHSKHKIKDFLLILFGFHFIFNPVGSLLKNQLGLKFVWGLIFLMGLYLYFRKEASLYRIILSYVVLATVICFGELILIGFFHIFIGKVNQMTMMDFPFWFYIIQFLFDFILYTICIHFISKHWFVYLKENVLLILLYVNQMIILYFSVACLIYKGYMVTILHFFLFLFQFGILYLFYKRSVKKQRELTVLMLEKEYEKQLEMYMDIRANQEEYRMLRHDILNFVQNHRG